MDLHTSYFPTIVKQLNHYSIYSTNAIVLSTQYNHEKTQQSFQICKIEMPTLLHGMLLRCACLLSFWANGNFAVEFLKLYSPIFQFLEEEKDSRFGRKLLRGCNADSTDEKLWF